MEEELRNRVCRLIAGIVVSDSDVAEAEDQFIDRLLTEFGIAERDVIFPIVDRSEAAHEMGSLPPDVQEQALGLLIAAAVADGRVVDEERAYLHTVAEAMGVTRSEVDARVARRLAS